MKYAKTWKDYQNTFFAPIEVEKVEIPDNTFYTILFSVVLSVLFAGLTEYTGFSEFNY